MVVPNAVRQEDVALLRMLKKDQVLQRVKPAQLIAENGFVLCVCTDCDQVVDTWEHFDSTITEANKQFRPWLVPKPGGALRIPKSIISESTALPHDEVMLEDIEFGLVRKQITSIYLFSHAPCAAAADFNLSLFDQIELLVKAQERLEEHFGHIPGLEVKSFFHACYSADSRKTRFVSAKRWYENIESYREYDYTPGRLFETANA